MMATWARLRADRVALLALAGLVVLVSLACAAPLCAAALGVQHDVPDLAQRYCASSGAHPLGCDALGQDVLVRLLYGARISLAVGFGAAAVQGAAGVLIGAWAGWRGGAADALLMRVVDGLLALPLLPILLVAAALRVGSDDASAGVLRLIVILGAFGWMPIARVARAEVKKTASLDFVVAASALGASTRRAVLRHVLPNALAPVLVVVTLDVGKNILLEAALSYLGLGVRAPSASWGNMLTHAESELLSRPLLAFWPGLLIALTVLCVTVVGEGVRRALDPRAAEGINS
jgi:peptide/nickel transport system permease protein